MGKPHQKTYWLIYLKKLPEYFITAVKDWMIEEEIDDPKKISFTQKGNKIEVLENKIFN